MFRRWERFHGKPNEFKRTVPHVTISRKGVILMNTAAYEMAGRPQRVSLLYDKQHGVIGLERSSLTDANSFPVRVKSKKNRVIHASPFCRHHDINVERTMAFNTIEIEKGILMLDLNTLTAVGMGGRKLPVKRDLSTRE